VGHLVLARPKKSNAMSADMIEELPQALRWLDDQGARAVRTRGLPCLRRLRATPVSGPGRRPKQLTRDAALCCR
jgi:hypothetical protein